MKTALTLAVAAALGLSLAACSTAPEKTAAPVAAEKPAALKDAALAAAVKTALDADPTLKGFDIAVTGKGEDVKLDGSVATGQDMAQAGMIAEKVKGVRYVDNNLMPKN
ncbi:BON domain-containing protein [Jeongeupia wiesaeckerbachi]|uniref:BON domain-containing protein n=1 Tax=Jeongeupia wiesaeckerbachi TaxID=3051218 RepID=UPI003D8049BE